MIIPRQHFSPNGKSRVLWKSRSMYIGSNTSSRKRIACQTIRCQAIRWPSLDIYTSFSKGVQPGTARNTYSQVCIRNTQGSRICIYSMIDVPRREQAQNSLRPPCLLLCRTMHFSQGAFDWCGRGEQSAIFVRVFTRAHTDSILLFIWRGQNMFNDCKPGADTRLREYQLLGFH